MGRVIMRETNATDPSMSRSVAPSASPAQIVRERTSASTVRMGTRQTNTQSAEGIVS